MRNKKGTVNRNVAILMIGLLAIAIYLGWFEPAQLVGGGVIKTTTTLQSSDADSSIVKFEVLTSDVFEDDHNSISGSIENTVAHTPLPLVGDLTTGEWYPAEFHRTVTVIENCKAEEYARKVVQRDWIIRESECKVDTLEWADGNRMDVTCKIDAYVNTTGLAGVVCIEADEYFYWTVDIPDNNVAEDDFVTETPEGEDTTSEDTDTDTDTTTSTSSTSTSFLDLLNEWIESIIEWFKN